MGTEASDDTFLVQEVERPLAFEFFATDWISATSLMDAEQRGWYIQMLAWAWGNSKIQGTLPADEEELLQIAGNALLATLARNLHMRNSPELSLEEEVRVKDYQRRWKVVRDKWIPSPQHPDCVHNPRLSKVLRSMKMSQNIRKHAGRAGAEEKWRKYYSREDVVNNTDSTRAINLQVKSPSKILAEQKQQTLLPSPSLDLPQPSFSTKVSYKRHSSLFDEIKFTLTSNIITWLKEKYPILKEEDYEFLKEQFCNARYGQTAVSWARQFYTYVNNRMKEGYTPFSQTTQNSTGGKSNGKYESAAERNARENEEHLARLRSVGNRDSDEDSKALRLPPSTYK